MILSTLPSGDILGVLRGNGSIINTVAFYADGRRLFTGAEDGSVRLWPIAAEQGHALPERAKSAVSRCLSQVERKRFFLPLPPPRWYITGPRPEAEPDPGRWLPKPPYTSPGWRDRLVATDRGIAARLPK